jgi:hypothetical protein
MARLEFYAAVGVAAALTSAAVATAAPAMLAHDTEATVDGVQVGCAGVGETKLNAHWVEYPVRVEFADAHNKYLADGEIAVRDAKGRPVVAVRCEGPWILLKLKPGAYHLEGRLIDIPAKPQGATFKPPSKGQMRLVLTFPDA